MTQKKPDRWERMVKRRAEFENLWDGDAWLLGETVIKLLRKEHRAVVRLIRSMPHAPYLASDSLLRKEVLAQLIRRAT